MKKKVDELTSTNNQTNKSPNEKGRPPHFKTPKDLELKWDEFVEYCEKENKWLNKDKFCIKYGYYCNLFNEYDKKSDFSGILSRIEKQCKTFLLEKGLENEYNSAIVKLIASADYGMSEKNILAGDKDNPLAVDVSFVRQAILKDLEKVKSDKSNQDKVKREQKRHK